MNYNQLKTALSSTYRNNNTAQKDLKGKGFTLDKDLSGKRAKVFVDDKTGQAYVAHRGTHSIQDVFTDAGLLLGIKDGKRLRHAKNVHRQAEEKYGNVNSLGHSLGGYLAENSGNKDGKVITYNKASIGEVSKNPNQIDIRTQRDLVSLLTPKTDVFIQSKSLNPLTEHNTNALKRMGDKVVFA